MADHENRINDWVFEKDPIKFCQALYEEFDEHNAELCEKVDANKEFYNGIDPDLEKRASNKAVKRSSIFVHAIRPAIETGKSAIIDSMEEGFNDTVQLIPREDAEEQRDQIDTVAAKLNERLRQDGFLTSKFREALDISRVAPVAFIYVGWKIEYGWTYTVAKGPMEMARKAYEWVLYQLGRRPGPPEDRVVRKWDIIDEGPFTEVLDFDELLYDPKAHGFQESRAVIRRVYMTWNELVDAARAGDWDMSAVELMRKEYLAEAEGHTLSSDDSLSDREREMLGNGSSVSYNDGKFLVCEFHIPTWDKSGRKKIRKYFVGQNQYQLSRNRLGDDTGLNKFPFVPFATNKLVNQIEGVPHVEIGRPLQKMYNDLYNAANDVLTYSTFKILLLFSGAQFTETPKVAPFAIWKLQGDKSQFYELSADPGNLPYIEPMIRLAESKIEQIFNSPDFSQSKEITGEDEKVFQTRLRAAGSARRARSEFKEAGQVVVGVADIFIELYRLNGYVEWVFDASIDVPSLTGNYTPQEEQSKMIGLLNSIQGLPIYQTPLGRKKLAAFLRKLYTVMRMRDIDEIVQTDEELIIEDKVLGIIEQMQAQLEATNNSPDSGATATDIGENKKEIM